jgi:hypothetical protein
VEEAMPEAGGINIEAALQLNERQRRERPELSRTHEILEVVEAILLALVACATAWSGYQAARWDSQQSELYGRSSKLRIEAQAFSLQSNQMRQYNAANVNEWLKAELHGEKNLAELLERRFLPEFLPAFEAWKKTDPLHNPNAPAGPMLMPEYRDDEEVEFKRLDGEASDLFEQGTRARENGDEYVRATVTLATVLLLTAISQRFREHRIRLALIVLAALLLCVPLWHMFTLPRA